MSSETSDRDLLFGILAVERRLFGRDAFFAAVNAWTFDKSTPLTAVLVRSSALTAAAAADFSSVMDRHLREHGGDIARCLEAVAEPLRIATFQALRLNPDPDLRRFVALLQGTSDAAKIPAGAISASDPLPMPDEPPASKPQFDHVRLGDRRHRPWSRPRFHAGRFAAVSRIDGDGMGVIYIGYDREEIGRIVVLKTIRSDVQSAQANDLARRLRLEGDIHGQLEHPNILPVYGTGVTAEGQPFIALQYIRKGNLFRAIGNFHAGRPIIAPGQRSSPYQDLLHYARQAGLYDAPDTPPEDHAGQVPPVEPAAGPVAEPAFVPHEAYRPVDSDQADEREAADDSEHGSSSIRFDKLRGERLSDGPQ